MTASLGIKLELLLTVAGVVAVGVLVQLGLLGKEYAGIAIGALSGSGIRSVVGSATTPPVAPPAAPQGPNPPAGA